MIWFTALEHIGKGFVAYERIMLRTCGQVICPKCYPELVAKAPYIGKSWGEQERNGCKVCGAHQLHWTLNLDVKEDWEFLLACKHTPMSILFKLTYKEHEDG